MAMMDEDTCPTCRSATDLEVKNLYEEIDRLKEKVSQLENDNAGIVGAISRITTIAETLLKCQRLRNLQSL